MTLIVHAVLSKESSTITYMLVTSSWWVAVLLLAASYFLYRGALRGTESPKWLIVLPATWSYPIPVMVYIIAIHYDYFLRVLRGEEIFHSYHFPGVIELSIGLIIATTYTTTNM